MRLLGAHDDGYIALKYLNVSRYVLESQRVIRSDWLYDEVRLITGGRVVHEVMLTDGRWLIECDDLRYAWTAVSTDPSGVRRSP